MQDDCGDRRFPILMFGCSWGFPSQSNNGTIWSHFLLNHPTSRDQVRMNDRCLGSKMSFSMTGYVNQCLSRTLTVRFKMHREIINSVNNILNEKKVGRTIQETIYFNEFIQIHNFVMSGCQDDGVVLIPMYKF